MGGACSSLPACNHAFGPTRQALAIFPDRCPRRDVAGAKGFLLVATARIAGVLLRMGDIDQADAYLRRSQALLQEARTSGMPGWRTSYAQRGQSWEADYEDHRASILEARGRFSEAEAAYRLVEQRRRASLSGGLIPRTRLRGLCSARRGRGGRGPGRIKALGSLAEAEADHPGLFAKSEDQGNIIRLAGFVMVWHRFC